MFSKKTMFDYNLKNVSNNEELRKQNNKLYKQLLVINEKLSLLELIKDKSNDLAKACKCYKNKKLVNEAKQLIEKYDKLKSYNDKRCSDLCLYENFDDTHTGLSDSDHNNAQIEHNSYGNDNQLVNCNDDNYYTYNSIDDTRYRYECNYANCNKKYTTKYQVRRHYLRHTGLKTFVCNSFGCDKTFYTKDKLDRHVSAHLDYNSPNIQSTLDDDNNRKQITIKCKQISCDLTFRSYYLMNKHYKNYHAIGDDIQNNSIKERLPCLWPGCDAKFSFNFKLKEHMRKHTGEKPFSCTWVNCNHKFLSNSRLKCHIKSHKSGKKVGIKDVLCEWSECNKKFLNRTQMIHHYKYCHLKLKSYKCSWDRCEMSFVRKDQLDSHMGKVHLGEHLYKCDSCDKRYATFPALYTHSYVHNKKTPYKCDHSDCLAGFVRKDQLEAHLVYAHSEQRPYPCDWPGCEYAAVAAKTLKEHKMTHTGEKKYRCSWPDCGMSFIQAGVLKTHLRKHTNEMPYQCEHKGCDQIFKYKSKLTAHILKFHS